MDIYKDDGVIAVSIENKDVDGNKDIKSTKDSKATGNIINYSFIPIDKSAVYINNNDEYRQHMYKIASNYIIALCITNNVLHLVTERQEYYVIYLNKVNKNNLEFILNHDIVKKVCFNISEIPNGIKKTNVMELQFVLKVLLLKEFNSDREMFSYFGITERSIGNICTKAYNYIELAKKINIFVEKNKLNRYLYLEGEIRNILLETTNKGFPINVEMYKDYIDSLEEEYKEVEKQNINFNDKNKLLEYLNRNNKYLSLHPEILRGEDKDLYEWLMIYKSYKVHNNITLNDDTIQIDYDTYNLRTLNIKEHFTPNSSYYTNAMDVIEGSYKGLYFKILAELTRNKEFIMEASKGSFLEYISTRIGIARGNANSNHEIIANMFLEAYANNIFDRVNIVKYIYKYWHTYISSDDADNINKLFYDKMPEFMNFLKSFDGTSDEYSRYNTKIFHPKTNLHFYIMQIKNLIYKTAIKYVNSAINDFNAKYKDNMIQFGGILDGKLVLLSEKEHSNIAIDILNRYMADAYKRYIKKTKYLNATEVIKIKR